MTWDVKERRKTQQQYIEIFLLGLTPGSFTVWDDPVTNIKIRIDPCPFGRLGLIAYLQGFLIPCFIKPVALQPRRAKTDWSGCCQMSVQGALWLAKHLSLNLNFSFLNRISLFLISSSYPIVLTRLGVPRSRPLYFQKKFLGYDWELSAGPLRWQSDMLTTIPKRRSDSNIFNKNCIIIIGDHECILDVTNPLLSKYFVFDR